MTVQRPAYDSRTRCDRGGEAGAASVLMGSSDAIG
jgi:hypothetical protein